jgi:hypothetical protein
VQTDAVTMENREKGIVSTTTARNYVPYVLTGIAVGMGARYGISKLKAFKLITSPLKLLISILSSISKGLLNLI